MTEKLSNLSNSEINIAIVQALEAFKPELDPTKFKFGQEIDGKGFYSGTYKINHFGILSKIFDLYAAPAYLNIDRDTYEDAHVKLNNTKNWYGFDGETFFDKKFLIEAFKQGTYNGGWFIPTIEMAQMFCMLKSKFPQKKL